MLLGLLAFAIFGPLANMLLWTVTERWYFPHKLPLEYGFSFWGRVFAPRGDAIESLVNSIVIALGTVVLSLAMAIPAGYALARLKLPARSLILLAFLIPQAFPNLPVYINIARIFYAFGLNGLSRRRARAHHAWSRLCGLDRDRRVRGDRPELEEAARSIGAGPLRAFLAISSRSPRRA